MNRASDTRETKAKDIMFGLSSYQEERKENEAERIFKEITAEDFLNLVKETNMQIQEAK